MHGLAEGSNNYTLEWTTDATFAGPIEYDSDGDFLSDGAILYQRIDCKILPLPRAPSSRRRPLDARANAPPGDDQPTCSTGAEVRPLLPSFPRRRPVHIRPGVPATGHQPGRFPTPGPGIPGRPLRRPWPAGYAPPTRYGAAENSAR